MFSPHTQLDTHTHSVGLLWTSDLPVAEVATYTKQHTKETNIHALSGIETRDPSNQAASDPRGKLVNTRPVENRDVWKKR